MLKVYENVVTPSQLLELRTMFDAVVNEVGFIDKFFINDGIVQMERTSVKDQFPKMEQYCRQLINSYTSELLELKQNIMFTRVNYPSPIHVDSNKESSPGRLLILPLTFNTDIKTIVWKNTFNNNEEISDYKSKFINETKSFKKVNSLSKEVDISHCLKMHKLSLGEVMELDGMAPWDRGNIIIFDKNQAHCSSNFIPQMPFKEYLLVHAE
jgi:hypothetical protein